MKTLTSAIRNCGLHRQQLTLLFSIAVCLLSSCQESEPTAEPAQKRAVPTDVVPIATELDDKMFPALWLKGDLNTSAKPIADDQKERGLRNARTAMSTYPDEILTDTLIKIYLVGELSFSGIKAGGTNSRDKLYLTVGKKSQGYSNKYLRGAFHHEFSSILLRNHGGRRLKRSWAAANPKEFSYSGTGTKAVQDGKASEAYNESLAEKGFFSQYAQASYEEDFNTVATALLMGNPDLWEAAEQFPPLMKKVKLTMDFYESLDSKFNEAYFKGLNPLLSIPDEKTKASSEKEAKKDDK